MVRTVKEEKEDWGNVLTAHNTLPRHLLFLYELPRQTVETPRLAEDRRLRVDWEAGFARRERLTDDPLDLG